MTRTEKTATARAAIDENLKRIFEEDAAEELPDNLRKLLDRLDDVPLPDGFDELPRDRQKDDLS